MAASASMAMSMTCAARNKLNQLSSNQSFKLLAIMPSKKGMFVKPNYSKGKLGVEASLKEKAVTGLIAIALTANRFAFEELVTGLSRVSWEKVDVSFHSSRQRFAAHSVIQVKDQSMHIEGADVIQHMIDHFL